VFNFVGSLVGGLFDLFGGEDEEENLTEVYGTDSPQMRFSQLEGGWHEGEGEVPQAGRSLASHDLYAHMPDPGQDDGYADVYKSKTSRYGAHMPPANLSAPNANTPISGSHTLDPGQKARRTAQVTRQPSTPVPMPNAMHMSDLMNSKKLDAYSNELMKRYGV